MNDSYSGLDPIALSRFEDLMRKPSRDSTSAIVAHNMQQAAGGLRLHGGEDDGGGSCG